MHELSLCQTLIDHVEKEVERAGQKGRVVRLELRIGRLSGVCPDSLEFAFPEIAEAQLSAPPAAADMPMLHCSTESPVK